MDIIKSLIDLITSIVSLSVAIMTFMAIRDNRGKK